MLVDANAEPELELVPANIAHRGCSSAIARIFQCVTEVPHSCPIVECEQPHPAWLAPEDVAMFDLEVVAVVLDDVEIDGQPVGLLGLGEASEPECPIVMVVLDGAAPGVAARVCG